MKHVRTFACDLKNRVKDALLDLSARKKNPLSIAIELDHVFHVPRFSLSVRVGARFNCCFLALSFSDPKKKRVESCRQRQFAYRAHTSNVQQIVRLFSIGNLLKQAIGQHCAYVALSAIIERN